MTEARNVLFLPGAGGSAAFWKPVADRLPQDWRKTRLSWPGLGNEPPDPAIDSMDGLVALTRVALDRPTDIVAQSMGGVVAVRLALERPDLVRRVVLTCCSGGLDVTAFGAVDWRPIYLEAFPSTARWIVERAASPTLPFEWIEAPTLLIAGENDPISPPAVSRHLAERIPGAKLKVIAGADHELATTHVDEAAALVRGHLEAPDGQG